MTDGTPRKITALEKQVDKAMELARGEKQASESAQSAMNLAEIALLQKDTIRTGYKALEVRIELPTSRTEFWY